MIGLPRAFGIPADVQDQFDTLVVRLRTFLLKGHNADGTHPPFVGYRVGEGGLATQATSKATGVTLNTRCGQLTLNAASLAADTTVSFTLTNLKIAADDLLILNHISGGTAGSYLLNAQCRAGSATISVRNITTGALAETVVIAFLVVTGQSH